MKHNSVTTIKCRLSNTIHKMLEPKIGIKKSKRWSTLPKKELTNEEKIKLFDQIVKLHAEGSEEISNALYKRREKKRVNKLREANGYVPKKKTTKAQYEAMLLNH